MSRPQVHYMGFPSCLALRRYLILNLSWARLTFFDRADEWEGDFENVLPRPLLAARAKLDIMLWAFQASWTGRRAGSK